jgi:hypothetical protein
VVVVTVAIDDAIPISFRHMAAAEEEAILIIRVHHPCHHPHVDIRRRILHHLIIGSDHILMRILLVMFPCRQLHPLLEGEASEVEEEEEEDKTCGHHRQKLRIHVSVGGE